MLRRIQVRDFAIIDALEIALEPGLTVLTGETGAGKSILLDALGLCLGDRADTSMVPAHAERSDIHVEFDVADTPRAAAWLADEGLDEDQTCLLRRVIQNNGRSQAWINGRPATRGQLETLGSLLVGIHGQHAHQALMHSETQRRTLDHFAGNDPARDAVADLFSRLQAVDAQITELAGGSEDHTDRMALLRYQLEELEAEALEQDAFAELEREQKRLASAGEILSACQQSLEVLYEAETNAQSLMASASRVLATHLDTDAQLAEAEALISTGQVQIEEACQTLRHFADGLEMDPERLDQVEKKLSKLFDLARKHQVEPEALSEHAATLRAELERLESADTRLVELQAEREQLRTDYAAAAQTLSQSRQQAAETLNARVNELLGTLGLKGAALEIGVDHQADGEPTRHGLDRIRFDVRTNPDQPAGPLSRVASGGELSRIGLALEVATADVAELPCLIFDEADAGIGGAVAEVVGRQLRALAEHHQVLCITHLPQVASQGMHQLQVEKHQRDDGRTVTQTRLLAEDERTQEIARMLGGVEITEKTLQHAREMLEQASA